MSIVLNGTSGITSPEVTLDNTTADGGQLVLKSSGYSNWNLDNYSGRFRAYYNATEYMTIDTSGNVGIGTTSPGTKLDITNGYTTDNNTSFTLTNSQGSAGDNGAISYRTFTGSGYITSAQINSGPGSAFNASYLKFRVADSSQTLQERMRIDSSGNVGIGTSSPTYKLDISSGNSNTLNITTNNTNTTIFNITRSSVTTVTHTLDSTGYKIINGGSGGLYLGYTGTSWTSLSDERFKTDLKPIENAIDKVSTLRAVTGRFKTDEEIKSRSFLIAQDIQEVLPEAVDASNPEQLGVSYTDIIPLLVAAIKELSAKVDAQQQEINALKEANNV